MQYGDLMQFECPHGCKAILLLTTDTFPIQRIARTQVKCTNCEKLIPIGVSLVLGVLAG